MVHKKNWSVHDRTVLKWNVGGKCENELELKSLGLCPVMQYCGKSDEDLWFQKHMVVMTIYGICAEISSHHLNLDTCKNVWKSVHTIILLYVNGVKEFNTLL